jgi:Zn-finger nucleic acid-binding protein/MFS family permease
LACGTYGVGLVRRSVVVQSGIGVGCPACAHSSLVEFEAREDVRVEFCQGCKGMLMDELALQQLAGTSDIEAVSDPDGVDGGLRPCLRCNTANWRRRVLQRGERSGLGLCGTCGMVWLEAGELERLRQRLSLERRRARALASRVGVTHSLPAPPSSAPLAGVPPAAPSVAKEFEDDADRISFDRGVGNRIGVPLMLTLSALFCSNPIGQFLAGLIGMPFHELGHALTSWLSSRVAVPLPFFTIWQNDQSLLFGLAVAGLLGWFGHHSWREKRRFGVVVAGTLLATQVCMSWLVPTRFTLMLQIMGGTLGELVLAALLLAAFHFPLPDRLRWDFWRWLVLIPAAVCFGHALLVWIAALDDPSSIPWGAAIGDESDGDMNRLVRDFGWRAEELVSFYLRAGVLSALGMAGAYGLAWHRQARLSRSRDLSR